MYLYIVFLYTYLAVQNGGTDALPSTTPMSKPKISHKFYSKTAELIDVVNKFFNHGNKPVAAGKVPLIKEQSNFKRGHFDGREIDEDYYDSKKGDKEVMLETVMKLIQKNYDVNKKFGQDKGTIRVHVIRNPEVIEMYRQNLRSKNVDRSTSSSSSEATDEDYFDRKLREMLLRRNSVNFRLGSSDVSSEGTVEEEASKVTKSLPQSIEEEVTPFKLPFEYDEMKNMEMLINSEEFNDDVKLITNENEENTPEASEATETPEAPPENGAWDVITKNYKWGDDSVTEKSNEDPNWENTKRRETANSWEKKDSDWNKKANDWDKKDKSYEKKDDWNKKTDDWNKRDNWDKKDDWNKKSEDRVKKNDDWNKKTDDWNKNTDDWNKKTDDWNKKTDDWNKKPDDWNKKNDEWNKKPDDWNKKNDDWNKKPDDWNKKSDTWDKKDHSWEKKDDWNRKNEDFTKRTYQWDKPSNDWNREGNWDTKDKKTTENWDKKDTNWNREDDWSKKTKKNDWDTKDNNWADKWDNKDTKKKKDDDWDKPTRDWDTNRDRKDKKNDWDTRTTRENEWDKKRDNWDVKNTDRDKTDLRTNKKSKDNDYKRKNKWDDDWQEKKYGQSSERDKTKGLESYERETTKEGKVKKKGNEWDSYVPKSDDYYKPKKIKRVDSYERNPPAAAAGHSFGRTPIPFAGKKRIYDK